MAGSWRRVLESSNKARVVKELARRCEGSDYSAMSERKNTAVLVPLVMGQQDPEVLFTVRSRGLRQHRGQVRSVRVNEVVIMIISCPSFSSSIFSRNQARSNNFDVIK